MCAGVRIGKRDEGGGRRVVSLQATGVRGLRWPRQAPSCSMLHAGSSRHGPDGPDGSDCFSMAQHGSAWLVASPCSFSSSLASASSLVLRLRPLPLSRRALSSPLVSSVDFDLIIPRHCNLQSICNQQSTISNQQCRPPRRDRHSSAAKRCPHVYPPSKTQLLPIPLLRVSILYHRPSRLRLPSPRVACAHAQA